jgi:hypothetical protein
MKFASLAVIALLGLTASAKTTSYTESRTQRAPAKKTYQYNDYYGDDDGYDSYDDEDDYYYRPAQRPTQKPAYKPTYRPTEKPTQRQPTKKYGYPDEKPSRSQYDDQYDQYDQYEDDRRYNKPSHSHTAPKKDISGYSDRTEKSTRSEKIFCKTNRHCDKGMTCELIEEVNGIEVDVNTFPVGICTSPVHTMPADPVRTQPIFSDREEPTPVKEEVKKPEPTPAPTPDKKAPKKEEPRQEWIDVLMPDMP